MCLLCVGRVQAEREAAARDAERKRRALQKQLEENDKVMKKKQEAVKAEQEEDRVMMEAVSARDTSWLVLIVPALGRVF